MPDPCMPSLQDHMTQCSLEALALWEAGYPPPQPAPAPAVDDPSVDTAAALAALEAEFCRFRKHLVKTGAGDKKESN